MLMWLCFYPSPLFACDHADHNELEYLACEGGTMPKLRTLRLSDNRLSRLNVAPFNNLRTLYADNNRLGDILYAHKLTKLENLSLRNQNGKLCVSFPSLLIAASTVALMRVA
jgi:protein NUD1